MPAGGTIAARRNRNESSARSFQGRLMPSLHLRGCVHNGTPDPKGARSVSGDNAGDRAAARYFQSSLLASLAPSASACSFAQAICG
jgi:hypothetical protein